MVRWRAVGEAHHFLGEALRLWQIEVIHGRFVGVGEHHIEVAVGRFAVPAQDTLPCRVLACRGVFPRIGYLLRQPPGWTCETRWSGQGNVISHLGVSRRSFSRSPPQHGQQTGLRIVGVRQLDFVTEHATGTQELRLRGDDVEARIH